MPPPGAQSLHKSMVVPPSSSQSLLPSAPAATAPLSNTTTAVVSKKMMMPPPSQRSNSTSIIEEQHQQHNHHQDPHQGLITNNSSSTAVENNQHSPNSTLNATNGKKMMMPPPSQRHVEEEEEQPTNHNVVDNSKASPNSTFNGTSTSSGKKMMMPPPSQRNDHNNIPSLPLHDHHDDYHTHHHSSQNTASTTVSKNVSPRLPHAETAPPSPKNSSTVRITAAHQKLSAEIQQTIEEQYEHRHSRLMNNNKDDPLSSDQHQQKYYTSTTTATNKNNNNNEPFHSELISATSNNLHSSLKRMKNEHLDEDSTEALRPLLFDINGWALRVSIVGFFAGAIAVGIPQMYFTIPNSISFGLRTQCSGNTCSTISFEDLQRRINCDANKCSDGFDQFRLRWGTIEGFGWLGAVLLTLVAFWSIFGFTYPVRPNGIGAAHVLTSIVALTSLGASLVTLFASLNCGSSCFEYGASAIMSAVAGGLCFVMMFSGIFAVKSATKARRKTFGRVTAFGCIVAVGLQLYALLTSKWIFILPGIGQELPVTNFGLLLRCLRFDCELWQINDLAAQIFSSMKTACETSGDALGRDTMNIRLWVSSGCIALSALLCVVLAYICRSGGIFEVMKDDEWHREDEDEDENETNNNDKKEEGKNDEDENNKNEENKSPSSPPTPPQEHPTIRLVLICVIVFLVTGSNVLVSDTLDSFLFCGKSFCEYVSSVSTTTSCDIGVSYGCILVFNILFALLLVMEVFQRIYRCCYDDREERDSMIKQQLIQLFSMIPKPGGKYQKLHTKEDQQENDHNTSDERAPSATADDQANGSMMNNDNTTKKNNTTSLLLSEEQYEQVKSYKSARDQLLQTFNPFAMSICKWYLWIIFILSSVSASLHLVALVFTGDWSVSADGNQHFGPWRYCENEGKNCFSYSTSDCSNGDQIGSPQFRHMIIGIASFAGAILSVITSVFLTFSLNNMMRLARLGIAFFAAVLQLMSVVMWSQRVYSCDQTTNACPSCSFGSAFIIALSGTGVCGLALTVCLVETISFYACGVGNDESGADALKSEEEKEIEQQEKDLLEATRIKKNNERRAKKAAEDKEKMKQYQIEVPSSTVEKMKRLREKLLEERRKLVASSNEDNTNSNPLQAATSAVHDHEMQAMMNGTTGTINNMNSSQQNNNNNNENQSLADVVFNKDSNPADAGLGEGWYYLEDAQYWWNDDVGMYYDHRTQTYGNPDTGVWLSYNAETGDYEQVE